MLFRLLGATSLIAVVATNTSRSIHPQERYHTKKEEHQTSNYQNYHNNHPHYQFQYQLKPKYPTFSRYGQTVDIEPTIIHTKKSKSKRSKSSKRHL